MTETDEISFRPATLADKDGIIMHRGLFCNFDPMESERFEVYMNSPLRHKFVAVNKEGVVVSFLGVKIVDDGETAYYYGARTRDGYGGRGIQTRLLRHALDTVRRQFPVKRVWMGTWDPKFTDEYYIGRTDKRKILRKKMVSIALDTSKPLHLLTKRLQPQPQRNIHQIHPWQISNHLKSARLLECFDNGVVFYDYYCCHPRASNSAAFCELLKWAFVGVNDKGDAVSLSTCGGFDCTARGVYRMDIGINVPDLDTALHHALENMILLVRQCNGRMVEIFFLLDGQTDAVKFEKWLTGKDDMVKVGSVPREHWYANVVELVGM